jgi:PleD family two-component response regulator
MNANGGERHWARFSHRLQSTTLTGENHGPSTLLLVHDEAPLRHALAEILRDSAYIVLEAAGSQEALTIARDYPGAME